MKIWLDAQLPPMLANWLSATLGLEAFALRDLSLRDAQDIEIFEAARAENAVIMTKDSNFIDLVCRLGTPPQILWLTCGNVTKFSPIDAKCKFFFCRSRGILEPLNHLDRFQILRRRKSEDLGIEIKFPV
jgi:predicted nuclease of predicted toxin-antitoxin system